MRKGVSVSRTREYEDYYKSLDSDRIKIDRKKRFCLKCGEEFPSKGIYNRICEGCATANERVASYIHSIKYHASEESLIKNE